MKPQVGAQRRKTRSEIESPRQERQRHESFGRAARKATRIATDAAMKGWFSSLNIWRYDGDAEKASRHVTLMLRTPGELSMTLVWTDRPEPAHLDAATTGIVRFRGAYVSHEGLSIGPVLMGKAMQIIEGGSPVDLLAEEIAEAEERNRERRERASSSASGQDGDQAEEESE